MTIQKVEYKSLKMRHWYISLGSLQFKIGYTCMYNHIKKPRWGLFFRLGKWVLGYSLGIAGVTIGIGRDHEEWLITL